MVVFSNIAQSPTEVMDVVKDCHQTFVVVLWLCFCGGVLVFLWLCFCGGVFVVVFCGGVLVVFLWWWVVFWWCFGGGVFVVVFLWCFGGGVFKHRPKFY